MRSRSAFVEAVSALASAKNFADCSRSCAICVSLARSSATYARLPSARTFRSTSSSCATNRSSRSEVSEVSSSDAPLAPPPARPTAACKAACSRRRREWRSCRSACFFDSDDTTLRTRSSARAASSATCVFKAAMCFSSALTSSRLCCSAACSCVRSERTASRWSASSFSASRARSRVSAVSLQLEDADRSNAARIEALRVCEAATRHGGGKTCGGRGEVRAREDYGGGDRATTTTTRPFMDESESGDERRWRRDVGDALAARARSFERSRGVSRTSPSPRSERSRACRRRRPRAVACAGSRLSKA